MKDNNMEKEKSKKPKHNNSLEGQEALGKLYKELDSEGLLVEGEKPLLIRVKNLENEVNLLKDLFSRALLIDRSNSVVLKD